MNYKKIYKYGYDINKISQKIYTPQRIETTCGYFSKLNKGEYDLQQVFLKKGLGFTLNHQDYLKREVLIYLENGQVSVKQHSLKPQETLFIPTSIFSKPLEITSQKDSFVYIFSGPVLLSSRPDSEQKSNNAFNKSKTFDRRYKDWAENLIETIISREFTGKKIFFKRGNSSSLHFHCNKTETYFIHSGKLLLRFRAGQGEDKFFVVNSGQAVDITPGLMHQAGGLEDTIIIEISTRDRDTDSFIVESEFMKMPRLKKMMKSYNN